MPDWQERITRETAPAIRVEHELRYAAAAPLIHASAVWCDLGCGTGLAAAAALGTPYEGTAVLVDVDEGAVAQARDAIEARELVALTADLAAPADLERVRAQVVEAAAAGRRCITCFETIEHLADFAPLVALLVELARQADCTVVLSVPNDAFWAIENPHHATAWGEGAIAELRSLLPDDHVAAHQVALQGSALLRAGEATNEVASVSLADGVPTHFVLAFGPGAEALAAGPRVVQADLAEQRRWERQRESDLAYAEARIGALEATANPPATGAGGDAA
jgi:SAM-dependent methyltransferase